MTAIQSPLAGLALLASTGPAGFALQNGTPNILSWAAPNDGQLHRVFVIGAMTVTTTETGGLINTTFINPFGQGGVANLFNANLTAAGGPYWDSGLFVVKAGNPVTVVQASALTLGAATLWAEIWGS